MSAAIEATEFTPYINITSRLPRSGKTTLLQLLALLAANPWKTGRVTASVLVRKTDEDHPTLLLDESDAAFQANRKFAETLRGVLNSKYEQEGTYSMSVQVKKDWVPKDFSTFSPKAIAGLGRLPDTVACKFEVYMRKHDRSDYRHEDCFDEYGNFRDRRAPEPRKKTVTPAGHG